MTTAATGVPQPAGRALAVAPVHYRPGVPDVLTTLTTFVCAGAVGRALTPVALWCVG